MTGVKWTVIKVKLKVRDLLGSIPDQEKMLEYVKRHYMKEFEGDVSPDVELEGVEREEFTVQRFRRDKNGLYLVPGQILGWIKDAIRAAGLQRLLTKPWLRVFVEPRRIYLGKKEPDGQVVRPIRGPYGSVLSVHEIVKEAEIEFELWTKDSKFLRNWEVLVPFLKRIGLGPGRSKGEYGVIEELEWKTEEAEEEVEEAEED